MSEIKNLISKQKDLILAVVPEAKDINIFIIKDFISRCSCTEFEVLKDLDYDISTIKN